MRNRKRETIIIRIDLELWPLRRIILSMKVRKLYLLETLGVELLIKLFSGFIEGIIYNLSRLFGDLSEVDLDLVSVAFVLSLLTDKLRPIEYDLISPFS